MRDKELVHIILSHVGSQWRKVAWIIGQTLNAPELQILITKTGQDGAFDTIAARLQTLADAGKIEANGNLTYPR